jgi:hypothetical protein
VIPFSDQRSGLRDYRVPCTRPPARPRVPWSALLAFVLGLALGYLAYAVLR